MTTDAARKWLIMGSLLIIGIQMVFLIAAPSFGFPLVYPKNLDLLQIVTPTFLGYLGSASHFIFRTSIRTVPAQTEFLGMLVKGPVIIYVLVAFTAFVAFGYSNREGALIGGGMSVDQLATTLSLSLGILAATTAVITSYLFVDPKTARKR